MYVYVFGIWKTALIHSIVAAHNTAVVPEALKHALPIVYNLHSCCIKGETPFTFCLSI